MPPPLVQRKASLPEAELLYADDDRAVGADAAGHAVERAAGQVAQADHAAAARPAERLAGRRRSRSTPTTTEPSALTP